MPGVFLALVWPWGGRSSGVPQTTVGSKAEPRASMLVTSPGLSHRHIVASIAAAAPGDPPHHTTRCAMKLALVAKPQNLYCTVYC